MDEYLKKRPHKKIFQKEEIFRLRNQAIDKIKSKLLPDERIIKIILIGSSIKDSFGEYDPPGFRGSLFSDFDVIVFVEDDYQIPNWFNRELDGKPFPDDNMNLAYRNKKFIEDKYDIEVFFLKRTNCEDPIIQEQGELAGIPMTNNTTHKRLVVYEKMQTCPWCKGNFKKIDGPTHPYIESSPGCWHAYTMVLSKEYENYSMFRDVHRLTVDTYAVQHPGKPSRESVQSVWGHLIGLFYALEVGLSGDEAREKLKQFVESKPDLKWLDPPDFTGTLTVADVFEATSSEEHKNDISHWAKSVWNVWKEKHKSDMFKHVNS